eukprot:Nitzschia sp. Nitz4//scaffold288_size23661//2033//4093//NITZ4_008465-RA/size23661-processed-gene-0.16-mRNA-1//1//CDS//3329545785//8121//frame0
MVATKTIRPERESLPSQHTKSTGKAEKPEGSKQDEDWFSGVFSFFGTANVEEERNDKHPVAGFICGSPNNSTGTPSMAMTMMHANEELREDIDNESTSSETVSTLGKGLGDDLQSLPSVCGVPGEDASTTSFENLSISKQETPRQRTQHPSTKNESVEAVVEKKIHNLRFEKTTREPDNTVPFLRKKMFPKVSGRADVAQDSGPPDSVVETRRQLLIQELRRAVDKYGRYDPRSANVTAALGDMYDENQEYRQAIRLHLDAVSVYSAKLGDDNPMTIEARVRLGQVQENAGEYDDAISTFYFVMNMVQALKGTKDPASSDAMVRVAGTLRKKGRYELAIKTLKRALKTYREVLGDSHHSVSKTVDAIASLYVTIGDFAKASAILEEVVKLKAATMGTSSVEVAASLSELATCYECAEQYSKAMKNLKKAYKIYADVSGESGEKSILSLERIALIYQATGQFKKAAIAYLGVLRGRKRALGESHPTVADTYFHLGVSLRESGQQEKAFKCMKQALNIYVGEGKDMHDVEMIAEVMHELAIIHKANNNLGDAIKTFKQEVAVRRKLGQPEYPLIAQTLNHLGVAEFEIKNHNRALNYFMEALTIYEKKGTESGTDFAEVLYNTGLVFEAIRNKQRALDAFLEAASIFKENGYTEDHPHLSKAMNKLRRLGHGHGSTAASIPASRRGQH